MYNITENKKGKFRVYTIKDEECKTMMEVIPERGGIVSGLVVAGKDILYMEEDTLFDENTSVHGGIPILFPICGLLKNNKYKIQEKEFSMKRHGFARNYPWQVCESEVLSDSGSITLKFTSSKETLRIYPYEFELFVKYILNAEGLKVECRVNNKNSENMPFYLGFHPYFNVSNKENINIDISYSSIIDEFNNGFKDGKINILNEETNLAFCYPSKSRAVMKDRGNNIQIELNYDSNIKYLVLWAQGKNEFLCIEPWMAYTDAMNLGKDLFMLKNREELNINFDICIKNRDS